MTILKSANLHQELTWEFQLNEQVKVTLMHRETTAFSGKQGVKKL
jgi:hypothetical protein